MVEKPEYKAQNKIRTASPLWRYLTRINAERKKITYSKYKWIRNKSNKPPKNNKAVGRDQIPAELYKNHIDWWAKTLRPK